MGWTLDAEAALTDGSVRWRAFGDGGTPTILVHGTPYSSFLWRDIAVGLSRRGRRVYVFDLLGYGQSEQREGQDLMLAAQGRRFAGLLRYWNLHRPSVIACDIGGAIVSVPCCSKARRTPTSPCSTP